MHISGPSVVRASTAAGTPSAFGDTASLRERLAIPFITTTATTTSAGKELPSPQAFRIFFLRAKSDWESRSEH